MDLDAKGNCRRFEDAEHTQSEIIKELRRIFKENFSENDYDIIIEAKEIFIKNN